VPTHQRPTSHQISWQVQRTGGLCYASAVVEGHRHTAIQHLTRAAAEFLAKYPQVAGIPPTLHRTKHGWYALLCGYDRSQRRHTERYGSWPREARQRLEMAYGDGGMAACEEAFPERSADAIASALRRYRVRERLGCYPRSHSEQQQRECTGTRHATGGQDGRAA
jgi:hypothetical protein